MRVKTVVNIIGTILIVIIITLLTITIGFFASLGKKKTEIDYKNHFAKWIGGKTETVISDIAKIDITTDKYAIEVDWEDKWHEGIGQSLFYGIMTNKRPGLVLISDNPGKLVLKAQLACIKYGIALW